MNGSGVNVGGANVSGVNVSGVNGSGVNGSGVNGSGVNGSGVNGSGVNGSGVNGSGVNVGAVHRSGGVNERASLPADSSAILEHPPPSLGQILSYPDLIQSIPEPIKSRAHQIRPDPDQIRSRAEHSASLASGAGQANDAGLVQGSGLVLRAAPVARTALSQPSSWLFSKATRARNTTSASGGGEMTADGADAHGISCRSNQPSAPEPKVLSFNRQMNT